MCLDGYLQAMIIRMYGEPKTSVCLNVSAVSGGYNLKPALLMFRVEQA